jgi:hypothetical protein
LLIRFGVDPICIIATAQMQRASNRALSAQQRQFVVLIASLASARALGGHLKDTDIMPLGIEGRRQLHQYAGGGLPLTNPVYTGRVQGADGD